MNPDPISHMEKVSWLDEQLMVGDERDARMHAFGILDRAWRSAWHAANSWVDVDP